MQILITLCLSFILAWTCSQYAQRCRRNPSTWFLLGGLFGIFALIALFILAARKPIRVPASAMPIAPKIPTLTTVSPSHAERLWYYLNEESDQFGPMSFNALGKAWREGSVKELTYVWNEEMESWQPFNEVIKAQE